VNPPSGKKAHRRCRRGQARRLALADRRSGAPDCRRSRKSGVLPDLAGRFAKMLYSNRLLAPRMSTIVDEMNLIPAGEVPGRRGRNAATTSLGHRPVLHSAYAQYVERGRRLDSSAVRHQLSLTYIATWQSEVPTICGRQPRFRRQSGKHDDKVAFLSLTCARRW
jgi:hypothetical protein